jgi:ribose transport system substrate-binding protein
MVSGVHARRWRATGACALTALAFGAGVAACGSDEPSSSSSNGASGGSTADSAGVATAKADVDKLLQPPTAIPVTQAVTKAPPKGKTVAYLSCPSPSCLHVGDGVRAAGAALGWKVTTVKVGATPEEVTKAWDQLLQNKPDAVIQNGFSSALFAKQLKQLKADGIPYVAGAVVDDNPDILQVVAGQADYADRGAKMAQWVVADTGGKGGAIFAFNPLYPALVAEEQGFEKEYKKLCPTCEFRGLKTTVDAIGKTLPGEIVSAVQRDSKINYVLGAAGSTLLGVPEAIKSAGLDNRVKAMTQAGEPANYAYIEAGNVQSADLPYAFELSGWLESDVLVRHFVGDDIPTESYVTLPKQILTKDTIADPSKTWPSVVGYEDQFKKLWGIG